MNAEELKVYQESLDSIPFHKTLGVRLERLEPSTQLTMTPEPGLAGFGSVLHGGAIAALVDIAAGVEAGTKASGYDVFEDGLVTVDTNLKFRSQPRKGVVTAEARLEQQIGQLLRIECELTDGSGRVVAQASVNSVVLPGRLKRKAVKLTDAMRAANAVFDGKTPEVAGQGSE